MIYIVEDDASIRELEEYALQSNGYDATGCEDAASFWAALHQARPELVILDVMRRHNCHNFVFSCGTTPLPRRCRSSWSPPRPARSMSSRDWTTARTITSVSPSASWSLFPGSRPCCAALRRLPRPLPPRRCSSAASSSTMWPAPLRPTVCLLESRTIDMHVRTLRQKLGAAGEAIRTVRKVGYKLSTEGADE